MLVHALTVFVYLSANGGVATAPPKPYRVTATQPAPHRVGTPLSGRYVQTCEATIFCYKGDPWCGGATPYLMRRVRPTDVGAAHRTLPYGTKIRITNHRTKLSTEAIIIDRGPFGRLTKRGGWYNGIGFYLKRLRARKPIPTSGWRGCLDITPRVGRQIRHNGKEDVTLEVIRWPRRRRKPVKKPNT
jgi:hypothetical protein